MKKPIPKTVMKTDGNGNEFEVPNPDLYNDEGERIKYRRDRHNPKFHPKKKKRK